MTAHEWYQHLRVGGTYKRPANITWDSIRYAIRGAVGYTCLYRHLRMVKLQIIDDNTFKLY